MASSFDFTKFVTRLEDLKITKNGWDKALLSFTTAWNENSYDIKLTAGKIKSFIVTKYGKVPPELRDDFSALISGKLKPAPGDRGLRLKDYTPNSKLVPNEGKVDKPDSGKSERPMSKQKESKPADHQTSFKDNNLQSQYDEMVNILHNIKTEFKGDWGSRPKTPRERNRKKKKLNENFISFAITDEIKDTLEAQNDQIALYKTEEATNKKLLKTLQSQLTEQWHEIQNRSGNTTYKSENQEQNDDTFGILKDIKDQTKVQFEYMTELLNRAISETKEIQIELEATASSLANKGRVPGDEKLQTHLENVWNLIHQGHVRPPYRQDEPDLNDLALKLFNRTKSLVGEIKSLTAHNKYHTQKEEQHTRDIEQLFELLQFDDLAETIRPKLKDNAIADGPITFEIIYKRVEQLKEHMKTMCALPDHQNIKQQLHNQQTRLEQLWTKLHADKDNTATESSEKKCPDNFDMLSEQICSMVKRIQQELIDSHGEITEQLQQYNEDMKNLWNALQKPSSTQHTCKPPDGMNKMYKEIHKQVEKLQQENAEIQHSMTDLQDKLEQANLERQAQERSTRLSKIQTSNMTASYPVVYELSDASRPTKLGERFSELYDFQWTDAFEQLSYSGRNEKDAIQYLYELLEKCHTFCIETDKYQTSVIQSSSTCSFHDIQTLHVFTDIKLANVDSQMMLDLRKRNIEETTRNLQNQFVKKNGKTGNFVDGSVKVFVDLCVEICWLMRLHSPPLFLDTNADTQMERQFDTKIFSPYTRSGKTIEFVVWPPLYLHEGGPMLSKGTAQGSK